jgi:hypothetical protein
MTVLDTKSRFADPDAAYRAIIEAHRGLTEAESADLNAALVLILANQVGDLKLLLEALALARSVQGHGSAEGRIATNDQRSGEDAVVAFAEGDVRRAGNQDGEG